MSPHSEQDGKFTEAKLHTAATAAHQHLKRTGCPAESAFLFTGFCSLLLCKALQDVGGRARVVDCKLQHKTLHR